MMKTALAVLLLLSLSISGFSGPSLSARSEGPSIAEPHENDSADSLCPPLPQATGLVVTVSTVAQLQEALSDPAPDTTILIADGTYHLDGAHLRFSVPGVTLRSASGNRDAAVLDGDFLTTEIAQIVAGNITIADLTLREALWHPVHVSTEGGVDTLNTTIYNVRIIDPGQQAIKINPGLEGGYPDEGVIACSRIELTDVGRPRIWEINGSCYTGGVDAHQAQGWNIHDNHIEGFWCQQGLSEHALHFWSGCRDTLVERNVLVDNARGIGFGLAASGSARTYPDNPCPGADGGYVDHYGGIIRNNSIFASRDLLFSSQSGFDCGICLWQACGAVVVHNTVISTQTPFSSIEWRFDNTDADLSNNLVSHQLRDRGGTVRLSNNLDYQPLSLFVDGPAGNLHLAATATSAIDEGQALAPGLCEDDLDGDPRPSGPAPDIGADELATMLDHTIYVPLILIRWQTSQAPR
jgi:hypothetical protein